MTTTTAKIVLTADDKTKAAFASVQRNLAGIKSFASGLGLGTAFSVAGIVAFTKESIDALDSLNDLSKRTNVAVDDLAGLDLAAKSSGTSLESLATSFNKLSINIGKNREDYAALGVTATDPLEAFKQLADVFNSIQDPQDQAAFGAKAFGKAYAEIVPLLKEGGDNIGRLVARGKELSGVTQQMADDADKFNDQLEEFRVQGGAVGFQFAKVLLPSFNDTLLSMRELAKEGKPLLALLRGFAGLGKIPFDLAFPAEDLKELNTSATRIKELKKELRVLESDRAGLKKSGGGLLNNLFAGGDIAELDKRIQITKNQIAGFEKFAEQIDKKSSTKAADATANTATTNTIKNFIGSDNEGTKKAKAEIDKLKQALAELQKQSEESGRSGKALELYRLSVLGADNAQISLASSLLDSIEAQKQDAELKQRSVELIDKFLPPLDRYQASLKELDTLLQQGNITQETYNAAVSEAAGVFAETDIATRQAIESAAELNAILAQTPSEQLEKTRAEMVLLYQAFEQGKINIEQLGEGVDVVLGRTSEKLVETEDEFAEFGKQAARNIQDSFADFLFDPFSEGLDGMLQGFAKTVQRMVAEAAAAKIAKNLFGELAGGKGGGLLGDIFKGITGGLFNANGNVFNQNGLVAFANGGVVSSPTLFKFGNNKNGVMGEAGAEGILPLKRGTNGQLGVQLFGGSNKTQSPINVVMNINTPDASSFRKSQGQISADLSRQLNMARRFS